MNYASKGLSRLKVKLKTYVHYSGDQAFYDCDRISNTSKMPEKMMFVFLETTFQL